MVLLDTCSFIWLVSEQNNLSDAGRNFIDNNRNGLCISSISAFEIGIKHEKKRIILPLPPQDWIREALTYHGILDIPVDWEIAERHNITERPQVINEYAKMTSLAGPLLEDKKVKEAQEIIVAWLKENNLLENEEGVTQNVSTAERTGGIIEPLPKLQWWIDTVVD